MVDVIPSVSVPRVLLALAAIEPGALDAAVAAAERRTALDLRAVDELLRRCAGRPGASALRAGIAAIAPESGGRGCG